MGNKVFIGIPVHSGTVMVSTVISLLTTMTEFRANGWDFPRTYFRVGDSDICRARNVIVAKFLKSDCDHLMMVDGDISWPVGAMTRLIEHDQDFVAGAYKGRTDEKELYFVRWPQKKEMWVDPKTGFPLLKVDGISIGFCRIRRACVEKLVADCKTFIDPLWDDEEFPWLIDFEYENGQRMEEGYSLCNRWRAMGGDVWLDPAINLGHMGPKVFESNMMEFLRKMRDLTFLHGQESSRMIEEAILEGLDPELLRA